MREKREKTKMENNILMDPEPPSSIQEQRGFYPRFASPVNPLEVCSLDIKDKT